MNLLRTIKNKRFLKILVLTAITIITGLIFSPKAHAAVSTIVPAFEVLKNTSSGTMGGTIKGVWDKLILLSNSLVVIVLIAVAFAQILRININTYGVKKILPTLVLAIIAANFSFLFCRLLVDFSNIMISALTSNGTMHAITFIGYDDLSASSMNIAAAAKTGEVGSVLWFCFAQLFLFAAGVIIAILAFLFFIRLWMIYFLVALSPIAIMAMVLQQTKPLFNQWWSNFSKWVFMPVASIFWLWLGSQWLSNMTGDNIFLQFVFAGVCFYLAITTPFKLGGAVMGAWGKLGKTAWGKTGGKVGTAAWNSTGGAGIKAVQTGLNSRWDRQKDKLKNRFYEAADPDIAGGGIPGFRRLARRMHNAQATQKYFTQQEKDVRAKTVGDAEKQVYINAFDDHISGRRTLNNKQLSRVYAKRRGYIGEERPTYAQFTAADVRAGLDNRHVLDGDGHLLPETDIAHLPTDGSIHVHAMLDKLRSMRNLTGERGLEARNAWAALFNTPAEAERAARQDIARDLLGPSSAVGALDDSVAQSQSAQHNMAEIVPSSAKYLEESAKAGLSFEEASAGHNEILYLDADALEELKENYGQLSSESQDSLSIAGRANGIKGIAGAQAESIMTKIINSPDLQHIDVSDITQSMSIGDKKIVEKHIEGIIGEIEEKMTAIGGKEAIDHLDDGLSRIKSIMTELKSDDFSEVGPISTAIRERLKEANKFPNDPLNSANKQSLGHADVAMEQIQRNKYQQIPAEHFSSFSQAMVEQEARKQRMAVVQGSSIAQGTVQSLASVGANVPLENLGVEAALGHLNQTIDNLATTTHEISHSSAAPMGEMRGLGIGAIADKEAFKQVLKDSQSGLREGLGKAKQAVFDAGYTGKDTLANPRVAKIFADATAQAVSQRLSKTPLQFKNTPNASGELKLPNNIAEPSTTTQTIIQPPIEPPKRPKL